MKNLGNLMKKTQEMQARMLEVQEQIANWETEGQAGGGMVRVVMTGKGVLKSVKIDPSLANAEDLEVLEDLIVAAANDAKAKADAHTQAEMQKVTGDLPLPPGMKLPF